MTPSALILLIMCFIVKANSEEIYSDNGWRPMSNEKVFELQRNFIKTPLDVRINNVPENPMDNVLQRKNLINIVYTNYLNKESIKEHEAMFYFDEENERKGRNFKGIKESDFEENASTIESKRKHKKMATLGLTLITDNDDFKTNYKGATAEQQRKTYEVEENLEEETNQHEHSPRDAVGYNYLVPKKTKANNFTSNLFDILANYNIRTDDKLSNYALSLRQNSRNSNSNDYTYMHVPIKIPLRYNSPNHFPIDPLLAVFLSNYGFYLPGLYGYHRSYNNLYGHLASNNIHNNKPFGSYKVYSDTDSLN